MTLCVNVCQFQPPEGISSQAVPGTWRVPINAEMFSLSLRTKQIAANNDDLLLPFTQHTRANII